MKDYTLGSSGIKEFILDYEIIDDKLIIKYASGYVEEVVYTNGRLKEVLLKMREQVLEVEDLEKRINKKNNFDIRFSATFSILFSILVNPLIHLIISLGLLCNFVIKYFERLSILKDYNKNKLFIENTNLFQNNISKDAVKNIDKKYKDDLEYLLEMKQAQDNLKIEVLMFFDQQYSILREPTIKTIDDLSLEAVEEIYNVLSDGDKKDIKIKKRVLTRNNFS